MLETSNRKPLEDGSCPAWNTLNSAVVWTNDSLVFVRFLSYDHIRNPCENLHQMSQSGLGIKQYRPKTADLKFGFLGLAIRLLGVGVIWPKDSLVLI